MSVAGIIFSNLHDKELPLLTNKRTTGAVPFGGRYRLIDFPLSAMVHAGLSHISVIAHHNYQSLMEHIGSGKDWDLARHTGGVRIVPPYSAAFANPEECYDSRMQSLISIRGMIERLQEEHVLCCDCDVVGTPDFGAMLELHQKSEAPMTVGTCGSSLPGDTPSLHIWVARRDFLCEQLYEAEARHYTSFGRDIVARQHAKGNVTAFRFAGRFWRMGSISDYYRIHMQLVCDGDVRQELLENEAHPIYTRIQNSPPVKYGKAAQVENSLIADGCVIEGRVVNSVLFRGVRVEEGCVVENAIVLENGRICDGACIHSAILDKHVSVGGGARLHGHPELPFLVEEGRRIG